MSLMTVRELIDSGDMLVPIPGTEGEVIQHLIREIMVQYDLPTACRKLGVSEAWVESFSEANKPVAEAIAKAQKYAIDKLEGSAYRRATYGVTEPIVNKKGEHIGDRVKYSDRLAALFLAAHKPEKYKEANAGAMLVPYIAQVPPTESRDEWAERARARQMTLENSPSGNAGNPS